MSVHEPDTPGGLRYKIWKGQKFWMCPMKWESGAECSFDTPDMAIMKQHMSGPHTFSGKPAPPETREVQTPFVDERGNPIMRPVFQERAVTPDASKIKFKE